MMSIARSLSRLTITAYVDRERKYKISEMTAMYNPESLSLGYSNDYLHEQPVNADTGVANYRSKQLDNLSLDLLFDAHLPGNGKKSVDQRLAQLRALCSALDAETGEPHFLRLTWGQMKWDGDGYFAGRLEKMNVLYSLFDRNGAPLRATASLTMVADNSLNIKQSKKGLNVAATSLARVAPGDNLGMLDSNPARLAIRNDLDSLYVSRGRQLAIDFNPVRRTP